MRQVVAVALCSKPPSARTSPHQVLLSGCKQKQRLALPASIPNSWPCKILSLRTLFCRNWATTSANVILATLFAVAAVETLGCSPGRAGQERGRPGTLAPTALVQRKYAQCGRTIRAGSCSALPRGFKTDVLALSRSVAARRPPLFFNSIRPQMNTNVRR
jgi:hypothetical protein